jgi:hypothetical protein
MEPVSAPSSVAGSPRATCSADEETDEEDLVAVLVFFMPEKLDIEPMGGKGPIANFSTGPLLFRSNAKFL